MAPRPRLFLGWQPLHSGCSLSSFPLLEPAPPLPPSPPPHSRASLRSCGYQATLSQRRDWWIQETVGGTSSADWRHERGRVKRGVTQESDWWSKWERAEAEILRPAEERIWSKIGEQRRDSGLVRRRHGGGTRMPRRSKDRDGRVGRTDLRLLGVISNPTGRKEES